LDFADAMPATRKVESNLKLKLHRSIEWIDLVLSNRTDRNKIVLVADSHEIADYNGKHPNAPLKIIDRRIFRFHDFIGMEVEKLIPIYIKATSKLLENGLLERIITKWVDLSKIRPPQEESDPIVLTFDHVGFTFYISGAFLILAAIVFLLELSLRKFKISLKQKFVSRYL